MPIVLKQIYQQDALTILELTDWLIKDNADGSRTERFTVQDLVNSLETTAIGNNILWFEDAEELRQNEFYLPADTRVFYIKATVGVQPSKLYRFNDVSMGVDDGSEVYLKPFNIDEANPGRYEQQL